jgi:hypothetical protein
VLSTLLIVFVALYRMVVGQSSAELNQIQLGLVSLKTPRLVDVEERRRFFTEAIAELAFLGDELTERI